MQLDKSLVRSFGLFESISDEALENILSKARSRRVEKGQPVFTQGQAAEEFYVLLNGKLKVTQTAPTGEEFVVRFVTPGEIFGVAKALGRTDYPATAEAVVESLILVWSSTFWDELVAK